MGDVDFAYATILAQYYMFIPSDNYSSICLEF